MNPIVLIPSRLASTRLPRKALADIHGQPMIVHVWRRAIEADLGPVVVATDSTEIADAVRSAGGHAEMSRGDHPSGTDRIAEVLRRIDSERRYDVVVNLQGDLPTVSPHVPRLTLALLDDPDVDIGTPVALVREAAEADASQVVKMVGSPVGDGRFRTLYFTRTVAPWGEGPLYHHIGLYAWRRAAIERLIELPPSTLEVREKLEQLRALEARMRVDAVLVEDVPLGVDTLDGLNQARRMLIGSTENLCEKLTDGY